MVRQRSKIRTSTTNSSEHVELKRPPKSQPKPSLKPDHLTALENLFGIPKEQLQRWPGATAYCRFLESCFQSLLATDYDSIWNLIGKTKPASPDDCWMWFNAICLKIHELGEENSIGDIWDSLNPSPTPSSQNSLEYTSNSTPEKAAGLIAIFAVLCWASMTLQPKLRWEDFGGQPSIAIQCRKAATQGLKLDIARRPIHMVFRALQRFLPLGKWQQPMDTNSSNNGHEKSPALFLSTLNYSTLKTIGKVRLAWVDNLTNHLDFEPGTRTLSIFRFPSLCVLSVLKAKNSVVLEGLARTLYKSDNREIYEYEMGIQINQEVLMSYRLLFAQTRSSRILAKSILKTFRNQDDPIYDPLLEDLCTRPYDRTIAALPISIWPISCRSFEDTLQEEDSYSSQDDFPVYGQRLAKLQEFCQRQQPSRLRDLWRDRRNPLQWYTFWAVLVVGGLSIFIALLQLGVGVAQLVTSWECKC